MSQQSSRRYLFHVWGKGACGKQQLRWQRLVRNHGNCLCTLSQRERVGSELAMRFGLRFQIKTVARQKKRFCRQQTGRSTHQADHSRSLGLGPHRFKRCFDPSISVTCAGAHQRGVPQARFTTSQRNISPWMRSRIIRQFSRKAASQIRSVLGAHALSAFVTNARASRTSNDVHRYFVNRVAPSRYRLHVSIECLSPRSQYRSAALCRPPWDRKAPPLVFPVALRARRVAVPWCRQ